MLQSKVRIYKRILTIFDVVTIIENRHDTIHFSNH